MSQALLSWLRHLICQRIRLWRSCRSAREPASLETPIGEEDDSNLGDFVADVNTVTPEGNVESVMLREHIDALLGDLKERERQVIELRFGLTRTDIREHLRKSARSST